ncbi:hypothetical protein cand_034340 [Cryptosporidium andersoni]|uniref:CLU central domain-containing protein n=1 Tax=Cryptosporidium andersoni TaxID=117008 RepID=A0A1J4MVZ3_9CRYT|nr:hypothetical protein cand_034340 [Cryptosporidium andersoni]
MSDSSTSVLVLSVDKFKLYSELLNNLPKTFQVALSVGLRHEPIRNIIFNPERYIIATLSPMNSEFSNSLLQVDHRVNHNFYIPIPNCLNNKALLIRLVLFLINYDGCKIPMCRSILRLSSVRDPTTVMKWFPFILYYEFFSFFEQPDINRIGKAYLDNNKLKVINPAVIKVGEQETNTKYIVGSIRISTKRVIQNRFEQPNFNAMMSFLTPVNTGDIMKLSLNELYNDSLSNDTDYSFNKSSEDFCSNDKLFNGPYSSRITGCYLESSNEAMEDKVKYPFFEFKEIISRHISLVKLHHELPVYYYMLKKEIKNMNERNRDSRIVLIGEDFFEKNRTGTQIPLKIPSKIIDILKSSLDWQKWLNKCMDVAIMQSINGYSISSMNSTSLGSEPGLQNMGEGFVSNNRANEKIIHNFDRLIEAIHSNIDVLVVHTTFTAAATEFARDIIDDVIFNNANQTTKYNVYRNQYVIWNYHLKRVYQELGMDYLTNNSDQNISEGKVSDIEFESDFEGSEDEDEVSIVHMKEKSFDVLESSDYIEKSECEYYNNLSTNSALDISRKDNTQTIPLYNSLKRRLVESIERDPIKPLDPSHPFSALRLFEKDLVFIHHNTIGKGLLGILVLGDDEICPEEASKIYTREITAHMSINEAIVHMKLQNAIRIYNSTNSCDDEIENNDKINENILYIMRNKEKPNLTLTPTNQELADILIKGTDMYHDVVKDLFHPAIRLSRINPTLITSVDYCGFRMVIRPLPPFPFTLCDWPLPIQSIERNEVYRIERYLNISNMLHPTKMLHQYYHLPVLLKYAIGAQIYYNFHHVYKVFPKDPWKSNLSRVSNNLDVNNKRNINNGSFVDEKIDKWCNLRPLLIRQSDTIEQLLKCQGNIEIEKRYHYGIDDLEIFLESQLEPHGLCLLCSCALQIQYYGYFTNCNLDKNATKDDTQKIKYNKTSFDTLVPINSDTHCSLCGSLIGNYETKGLNNKTVESSEFQKYIVKKTPYPIIGNSDDGIGIKMSRVKLSATFFQIPNEYYGEWRISEGNIFRRDEIIWERKPGIYCLPRSCISGGGNLLGNGLDLIRYALSQAKRAKYEVNDKQLGSKVDKLRFLDIDDGCNLLNPIKITPDGISSDQKTLLLSNSLHTNWLSIALHQLESIPVFLPYDSITLTNFMHSRGLNCHLFGRMINCTRSPWLRQLISVEIIARSMKNLIPNIIKTLYLSSALASIKGERGNYGKYCPCHVISPHLLKLHTIFKLYITSINNRKEKKYNGTFAQIDIQSNKMNIPNQTYRKQAPLVNTSLVSNLDKTTNIQSLTWSIQSPVYWNEIFHALNSNKWNVLSTYNVNILDISSFFFDWGSKFFDIEDDNQIIDINKYSNSIEATNNESRKLKSVCKHKYRLKLPLWILKCLFSINDKDIMSIKRYRFHQITIIQIIMTNLFNLILGDSPNSQLFWTKFISYCCCKQFDIAENSLSKYKVPIGALFAALQHHSGITFFTDIKKLQERLVEEPSAPLKYDDFNVWLPCTKKSMESNYTESLPVWALLEVPEIIKLPRYNNFSVISTPTSSQILISLSMKLSVTFASNPQMLNDYIGHCEVYCGAQRNMRRQDWIVQESMLELAGYFFWLESNRSCIKICNEVLYYYPQDHIAAIQTKVLKMWSQARLGDYADKNTIDSKDLYQNHISYTAMSPEIYTSTNILNIIELYWSASHPIIIDVYSAIAFMYFIRGNLQSAQEVLEKAITRSLVLSSSLESPNDILRYFGRIFLPGIHRNWEYEKQILENKQRKLLGYPNKLTNEISYSSLINKNKNEYNSYDSYSSTFIKTLFKTVENPDMDKLPKSPPVLRIAWLLKQLGKIKIINSLELNKKWILEKEVLSNGIINNGYNALPVASETVESLLESACLTMQWALDIFDFYIGPTTLETANCCHDLAFGLLLMNEVIDNDESVLLKRALELLQASFNVTTTLLPSFHFLCIENIILLALIYEKTNSYNDALYMWEIALEQLTSCSRKFHGFQFRNLCEFSILGWCTPNKYFVSPFSFELLMNYINKQNIDKENNYENISQSIESMKISKNYSDIITSKNIFDLSSIWYMNNLIYLLSVTKERIFYLFMNICNENRYHKRLYRLFLLASYLKRGDKLVNLQDWNISDETILDTKIQIFGNKGRRNNSNTSSNDSTSGLLFSVHYEHDSWLFESEESDLAVISFINEHPTKINKKQLFSGDGFSGPLSILFNKYMSYNENNRSVNMNKLVNVSKNIDNSEDGTDVLYNMHSDNYNSKLNILTQHLLLSSKSIKNEISNMERFFVNIMTEAENDIKIIWLNIREQMISYKINSKKCMKLKLMKSRKNHDNRIGKLSMKRIMQILNCEDKDINKLNDKSDQGNIASMFEIDYDSDIEGNMTNIQSGKDNEVITGLINVGNMISCPAYRCSLLSIKRESENTLMKFISKGNMQSTYDADEDSDYGDNNSETNEDKQIEDTSKVIHDAIDSSKTRGTRMTLDKSLHVSGRRLVSLEDLETVKYTKSSPLDFRSESLDVIISIIYHTTNIKDYFSNWKEKDRSEKIN